MGEFNSDDYYIYYCGQEYLRRNGIALMSTKESEMQYLGAISKMTMILVPLRGKPFNATVIQVYAQPLVPKKLKLNGSMKIYKTL